MQVGRRLIFINGKLVHDMGEMQGDIQQREPIDTIRVIDLEFGEFEEEFKRQKSVTLNADNELEFELVPLVPTQEEYIKQLEDALLKAGGYIE